MDFKSLMWGEFYIGSFCPAMTSLSRYLEEADINCPSQETEVTSTPIRPVENVVITTKDPQERNNNC